MVCFTTVSNKKIEILVQITKIFQFRYDAVFFSPKIFVLLRNCPFEFASNEGDMTHSKKNTHTHTSCWSNQRHGFQEGFIVRNTMHVPSFLLFSSRFLFVFDFPLLSLFKYRLRDIMQTIARPIVITYYAHT